MTEEELYKERTIAPHILYKVDWCKVFIIIGAIILFILGKHSSHEYDPVEIGCVGFVYAIVIAGSFEINTWRKLYLEQTKRRPLNIKEWQYYMDNFIYHVAAIGTLGGIIGGCAYESGRCLLYGVHIMWILYLLLSLSSVAVILYNLVDVLESLEDKIQEHKNRNALKK